MQKTKLGLFLEKCEREFIASDKYQKDSEDNLYWLWYLIMTKAKAESLDALQLSLIKTGCDVAKVVWEE